MSEHNGATHNILLWLTAILSAVNLGVAVYMTSIIIKRGDTLAHITELLEQPDMQATQPHE